MTRQLPSKKSWGPGPWQDEPDRVEFRAQHGMPCLLRRNMVCGNWCGYVAVAPGHPLHGRDYKDDGVAALDVHGGITYADSCDVEHGICHKPEPGEPDDAWWLGFDAGHAWDVAPGIVAIARQARQEALDKLAGSSFAQRLADMVNMEIYRDEAYMREQCEALAAQLHLMAAGPEDASCWCRRCGKVSYRPDDIARGYCRRCHALVERP